MSSLIVEICRIKEVLPHDNADRLEIVGVKGWYCIVGKDAFKVGDECIYIPIDTILPEEVEMAIFGTNSKIKLKNGRVRTIKIRGSISQGLVVSPDELGINTKKYPVGSDVSSVLKIIKYEEPVRSNSSTQGAQKSKRYCNPNFKKYTDIENMKNFPDVFKDGEHVYISEKLHGTSFRCGWYPTDANSIWKKILKVFGKLPKWEFCFGSRNIQLQDRAKEHAGYYKENVYLKMVNQYDLKNILGPGESAYGEIVGPGIQKGYHYGIKDGSHEMFLYDVKVNDEYLNHHSFIEFCDSKTLPRVPKLLIGEYNHTDVIEMTKGSSVLSKEQKVREGIVIKSIDSENNPKIGRKVLKFVSDAYLLDKNNTDFH